MTLRNDETTKYVIGVEAATLYCGGEPGEGSEVLVSSSPGRKGKADERGARAELA